MTGDDEHAVRLEQRERGRSRDDARWHLGIAACGGEQIDPSPSADDFDPVET